MTVYPSLPCPHCDGSHSFAVNLRRGAEPGSSEWVGADHDSDDCPGISPEEVEALETRAYEYVALGGYGRDMADEASEARS